MTSHLTPQPSQPSDVLLVNPIKLNTTNPDHYRNDVLAKLIPLILNPSGTLKINDPKLALTNFMFQE